MNVFTADVSNDEKYGWIEMVKRKMDRKTDEAELKWKVEGRTVYNLLSGWEKKVPLSHLHPPCQVPASLAQLVAWLFHWLGGTGFESQLGWPFISYHLILVCVHYDLNGSLRINSRLHARLDNQISHLTSLRSMLMIFYLISWCVMKQLVFCKIKVLVISCISKLLNFRFFPL